MSGWYNLIPDQAFDVVPGLPDLPARQHGNDHGTVSVGTAFAQHIAAGEARGSHVRTYTTDIYTFFALRP